MSIQAMNWAWTQNIPLNNAKFVLIAMADQADARDGCVRYRETSAKFFAQKCNVSIRTFWTAISLLVLNGYLARNGHELGGRGRATEFQLILDRPVSALDEWNDKLEPKKHADIARLPDEKLCEIAQQTMQVSTVNRAADCTVSQKDIISNQFTKERTSARARAASPSGARSRAKKTTKVEPDPHQFVCLNTHLWRALATYRSSIDKAMPKFIHRGTGEHANHTGTYFRSSELAAASKAGHDPPLSPDIDDVQPGEGDDEQFTAGLRRI
jgi:hypothetical protein